MRAPSRQRVWSDVMPAHRGRQQLPLMIATPSGYLRAGPACVWRVAASGRGWYGPPESVSRARRWSWARGPLALRLGAHKPTARWPPAPPSTALEAPVPGQPCPPGASAATRQLNIPKGPKKRARTRTTQIQMGQPPTTASPRSPGGSARRQATATALQGQKTHRRRPPGWCDMNLQTVSRGPLPV